VVYTAMKALEDLGGIQGIIFSAFAMLVVNISYYSFIMRAVQNMYIVRTRVTDLFRKATYDEETNKCSHSMFTLKMPKSLEKAPIAKTI
jgi:hypothetical protein